MSCIIPTLKIDLTDSAGDSVGKHNYNALSLDTTICNLSSIFYNNESNLFDIFIKFSSIVSTYSLLSSSYTTEQVDNILRANTTVNVLSAAWSHSEFSVLYPIDATQSSIVLASTNPKDVEDFVNNKFKFIGKKWLTDNFPPTNYFENTIIDLIVFPYNYSPVTQQSDALLSTVCNPKTFTNQNRIMDVNLSRLSICVSQALIVQFQNISNNWNYASYLYKDSKYSPLPFIQTTALPPQQAESSSFGQLGSNQIEFIKDGMWIVPDGVTTIEIIAVGGGGAGGGGTTKHTGGDGYGGHEISGKLPVKKGDVIKIYTGGGGGAGWNNQKQGDFGGTAGKNSLGYNGGTGGALGSKVSGGSGGGGGGATVVSVNDIIKLIAAGGGGGAGAGLKSKGRPYNVYASSGSIVGEKGTNKTLSDGGAGGGGGGGFTGGNGGSVYSGDEGGFAGSDGKDYFPIQGYQIEQSQNGGKGAPIYDAYFATQGWKGGQGYGWGSQGGGGSITIYY